jgi:hypothetical protein
MTPQETQDLLKEVLETLQKIDSSGILNEMFATSNSFHFSEDDVAYLLFQHEKLYFEVKTFVETNEKKTSTATTAQNVTVCATSSGFTPD